MEAKIQVKIKIAKGKEITLDEKEAKELFLKLKEIYDQPEKITYIPTYPIYRDWTWRPTPYTPYWTTTCGTATITYSTDGNTAAVGNDTTVTIK